MEKIVAAKDRYGLTWDGKRFRLNAKAVECLKYPEGISVYLLKSQLKTRGRKRIRIFICKGDTATLEQKRYRFTSSELAKRLKLTETSHLFLIGIPGVHANVQKQLPGITISETSESGLFFEYMYSEQ